jgi:hypothetical protein
MADIEAIAEVLRLAGRAHGAMFHYEGGEDMDWATFYSDWLTAHSPLGRLLGTSPIRSHLTVALVELDRRYTTQRPSEPWEHYYARELASMFDTAGHLVGRLQLQEAGRHA